MGGVNYFLIQLGKLAKRGGGWLPSDATRGCYPLGLLELSEILAKSWGVVATTSLGKIIESLVLVARLPSAAREALDWSAGTALSILVLAFGRHLSPILTLAIAHGGSVALILLFPQTPESTSAILKFAALFHSIESQ